MGLIIKPLSTKNSIKHRLNKYGLASFIICLLLILIQQPCKGQTDSLSLPIDTVQVDIDEKESNDSFLDDIVIYPSRDSTVMDLKNQLVKLYGDAEVKYLDITLKAEYIEFSFVNLQVKAYGRTDSLSQVIGKPDFKQGENAFKADTIEYNFDSERGLIKNVRTNDGESYIHTSVSKKQNNDQVHNYKGKLTTCDAEKPHFHFAFNKMVVKPNDKVITGPVIMKVGKVPTPLALPFGFFPNTTKRKAGIILPNYGQSNTLGFYLLGGGYYLPLGEYWDTQMTGDIYTRGTWGLANSSRYRKRYKYNGNFRVNYNARILGDREIPGDYSRTNSFGINWNHSQDAKARPGTTFSASVNIASSNNNTNNFNTSQATYLNNTLTSTVRYSKNWQGKPFNFSSNFRHSQNTLSRSFSLTMPNFAFNVNRFFLPLTFLKSNPAGKQRFYEKIGVTYSVNFDNKLNTSEPEIRFDNLNNLRREFVNGFIHRASVTTSLKMGYVSFNPFFNYNERWHFQRLEKTEVQLGGSSSRPRFVVEDEIKGGFFTTRDYSMGGSFTTKVYGTYQFKSKTLQAIRHTLTPSLGFSYTPEFNFDEFLETENNSEQYNPFSESAFLQSNINNSGSISLNLVNNLEAKMRLKKDSIASVEKVRLIENFSARTSYNIFADSLNLSNIQLSGRTRLFKKINVVYSGTFDPYQNDSLGRKIDRFRWSLPGDFLRNINTTVAIGGGFRSKQKNTKPKITNIAEEDIAEIERQRDSFVDFSVPWSLNVNYTLNIANDFELDSEGMLFEEKTVQQGILFTGDFSVFQKWKIGFDSGYDFSQNEFTPTSLYLNWDLHCWEFSGTLIPFGDRKSFTMSLRVKSSLLKDLNLQARGALGESLLLF